MLFIPGLRLIGAFNLSKQLLGVFGINLQQPISKAASEMRVLNNQVKDLNKEIRESRQEVGKLEKALDEYERLEKIVFKTKKETEALIDAQERLQELLGIELSGIALEIAARAEIDKQTKEIENSLKKLENVVNEYFETNPVDWEKALGDEQFAEFLDVVPNYAVEYAKQIIKGFEDMEPEIQEAIQAAIFFNPADFLNMAAQGTMPVIQEDVTINFGAGTYLESMVAKAGEDVGTLFARAQAAGYQYSIKDFQRLLEQQTTLVSLDTVEAYSENVAKAVEATNLMREDFAAGVALAKEINLDALPEGIAEAVDLVAPNIRKLAEFTEEELKKIGEGGGVAALATAQPILNALEGPFRATLE